jgi:outer membrane protein insertion porin family
VKRIEVSGNARIPTEQILAAVTQTKIGEPFHDEQLRADVRAINDLGWFADVSAQTEPEDGGMVVTFLVTENPMIAEIVVEGNTAVTADEIRTALGIPIGQVLNLVKMREGARAVQKLYEGKGFGLARVADLSILPSEQPDQARLRARIAEGFVETVRFEGLKKTNPVVAQRYVRDTKPGAIFNVNALQRDLQRLFDTGLFESIRARPEPGSTPDAAIIVIEVKEAKTAQASFGLGYSSRDGLVGFLEYRDRNWQGRAQSVVIRAERAVQTGSPLQLNYEVTFNEPFLDSTGTGLDLSVFSRATVEYEYTLTGSIQSRYSLSRNGAIAGLSRPFDGATVGFIRLRSELAQITALHLDPNDTSPCTPVNCPLPTGFVPGRVVSFQLGTTRDTRNARFNPTAGERLTLTGEVALAALGSDFDFTKYSIDYQRLVPVGEGSTLVARALLGWASGNLPLQERFILGGPSTVRGLPSGFKKDNSIAVANLEYRFPMSALVPSFTDITMILFADAGTAPISLTPPLIGYGVGLALNTALGQIRIDLAWNAADGTRQTWLSLGAPF